MANFSSFVYYGIPQLNWAGFYLIDQNTDSKQLVLGPFQGEPACIRIDIGKGVCGTAASTQKTITVDDVDSFPGHIACSSLTRSELVIPLFKNNHLIGVFDLDSPVYSRFNDELKQLIEKLCEVLIAKTDWNFLKLI